MKSLPSAYCLMPVVTVLRELLRGRAQYPSGLHVTMGCQLAASEDTGDSCCAHAQVPYAGLSGIQAALAVMHRGLRPDIPAHTPAPLAQLIQARRLLTTAPHRQNCCFK